MNLLCFSSNDKDQEMSAQEDFLKRLENVTIRLEAISGQKPALAPKPTNLGASSEPSIPPSSPHRKVFYSKRESFFCSSWGLASQLACSSPLPVADG
ncbi:hypothetical protein GCK72_023222 [Caenorhabditis remanei]|uniref:Uncharacterized protein n=1 Tax=Caenorhabditis remanei TaxID=31234 RepID=A0A6A5FWA6_CAERE|nr:hypothetical protein GCK72_023222 [Caenorhabditis remanei]KAF1746765.1 hypothetical protein GCK72_023222 [Caenorhabditis remanei]